MHQIYISPTLKQGKKGEIGYVISLFLPIEWLCEMYLMYWSCWAINPEILETLAR